MVIYHSIIGLLDHSLKSNDGCTLADSFVLEDLLISMQVPHLQIEEFLFLQERASRERTNLEVIRLFIEWYSEW